MNNTNGLKNLLEDNYKEITITKLFDKKLSAKVYTKRNKDIIEADFDLSNLFNAHLKYFINNIEEIYNSCLYKYFGDTTFSISPDLPRIQEAVIRYFKAEHKMLIDLLLDYSRSEPAELSYMQAEFLGKFKFFYNDALDVDSPLYKAFLEDIKSAIKHNNLVAIVALSSYNSQWLNLSKDVKKGVEKYKNKQKEAVSARGLSTSDTYYPVRSKNKQDVRLISKERYDSILKLLSLSYHLGSNSERAQARVLQSKDPRTTLASKREFFTKRPYDSDETKVSSLEENKKDGKRLVAESVSLQNNPIWYCLARREFLYDIYNPFFDEEILKDKKIEIADKQRQEWIQRLRTDKDYLNGLLDKMDHNLVDSLTQPIATALPT